MFIYQCSVTEPVPLSFSIPAHPHQPLNWLSLFLSQQPERQRDVLMHMAASMLLNSHCQTMHNCTRGIAPQHLLPRAGHHARGGQKTPLLVDCSASHSEVAFETHDQHSQTQPQQQPQQQQQQQQQRADVVAPLSQPGTITGRVHSIDSCTMVDGQGVRFMVFMQGCSARCCFCCNPDTWDIQGGTLTTPQQLAARIARLAPYLRPNGGGVTVSGGEPLLQPDFVAELFRLCHDMGLTTCLDTTGQAATSLEGGGMKVAWDTVLPHTDVVLLCVKHLDAEKYRQITGLQQHHALAFVEQLQQRGIRFWLRYVLLPGYTDAPADLQALLDFCRRQPTLQGVELLPYHVLGVHKWSELGLAYPLEGVAPPSPSTVQGVVRQLEAAGIPVICGAKEAAAAAAAGREAGPAAAV